MKPSSRWRWSAPSAVDPSASGDRRVARRRLVRLTTGVAWNCVYDPSLPPQMRYFDGKDRVLRSGTPWPEANFRTVRGTTEILPGFFVLTTRSEKAGTREMNELSLAIRSPRGLAVIVGCSHPGVENILVGAALIDKQLYTAIGGFHLVLASREEIERVVNMLHDTLRLQRVAPGHCTSEPGFAAFMRKFRDRFDQAGLGAVLQLPH